MFTVNSMLINGITGIGYGYEHLLKEEGGSSFLLGKWTINEQRFEMTKGKFYYFMVQIITLSGGLILGAIISYMFL